MKKIGLILMLLVLTLTGCNKKDKELDNITDVIINYHQDYNYDTSHLNENSKKLLSDFKEMQKEENKVINISKLDLFSEDITTTEPNSKGIYNDKGYYYIKYRDLDFKKINNNDYIATINVNGFIVNLSKSNFPILFTETRDINYKYRFMKKMENDNEIKYYYRSYGNGSMLTITYEIYNNEIKNIELTYDDYYLLDDTIQETEKSNIGSIIVMILIALGLGFFIIKSLLAFTNANKYKN